METQNLQQAREVAANVTDPELPYLTLTDLGKEALEQAGFKARVERIMTPPWTTDWITDEGRKKLIDNGIAPPEQGQSNKNVLFANTVINCPSCKSDNTAKVSEFGSTPCKAQYQCKACSEPFEYFKCH